MSPPPLTGRIVIVIPARPGRIEADLCTSLIDSRRCHGPGPFPLGPAGDRNAPPPPTAGAAASRNMPALVHRNADQRNRGTTHRRRERFAADPATLPSDRAHASVHSLGSSGHGDEALSLACFHAGQHKSVA